MRFRLLFPLGLCLASSVAVVAVQAQNSASKAPRQAPVPPKADENGAVLVNGKNSITDGNTQIYKLTNDVSVRQVGEDFILHCDSLLYNDPLKQAVATKNLNIRTTDSTVTGNKLEGDFNTKILKLFGNIVISTHGKKDGINGNTQKGNLRQQLSSKPSKLFCDRVDWDYEAREAVLTGNIRMTQGKNSGTCERIEFDEGQNVVHLLGNVKFIDDKGQSYRTGDLTFYINANSIETGRSTLVFKPAANDTAPRAPKRIATPKVAPKIPEEEIKAFGGKSAPIPTVAPEPTPIPEPTPEPEVPEDTPVSNRR